MNDKKSYGKVYYQKNKAIIDEKFKAYYRRNREKIRAKTSDYRKSHKEQGQAYRSRYRLLNLEKLKANDRAYRKANLEKRRESLKLWKANNKARMLKSQKKYNNSEKGKMRQRRWGRTAGRLPEHRSKRVASDAKRRAREIATSMPDASIAIYKIHTSKPKCFYCGSKVSKSDLHIDHMKPFHNGGVHAAYNLVPSCRSCNLRKGSKNVNQFVTGQQFLIF